MRFYEVNVKGDEVAFGQGKKIDFKVRAHQLTDFVYLIENVYSDVKVNDDLTTTPVSLDTAFLAPRAAGLVVPTARLAFNELSSFFSRRRSTLDTLLEGWRLTLMNVDYDALAAASDAFAAIDKYSYTIPMMLGDGEFVYGKLEEDFLGTVLQFNAAAKGQGEKPSVYREDLYDGRDVTIEPALVSKQAVGRIEDRGTHRVVHFKPEFDHQGRGGNKVSVTVETPMSLEALKAALGRHDIAVTGPSRKGLSGSDPKPS